MYGRFFCDICDHWFDAESDDDRAECPGCKEDVLEAPFACQADTAQTENLDDLFGLDHQRADYADSE